MNVIVRHGVGGAVNYTENYRLVLNSPYGARSKLKSCHLMQVLLRPLTNLESHMLSLGYKMVYPEIHLCQVGGICGLALVQRIPKLS